MTFPGDGVMLTLLAMWTGEGLETDGDTLLLTLPDGNRAAVPPAVLDTLEANEWVEITEHGAVPTPKGGYALNRWVTQKARQRGQHGTYELKSAKIRQAGKVA